MVGIHEDTLYHIYARDRCIYNCLDEEEVEELQVQVPRRADKVLANLDPSVVLAAREAALEHEVVRQPQAPAGGAHRHDRQPCRRRGVPEAPRPNVRQV